MEKLEILKQCTLHPGNLVKLPDVQLDRKTYLEVAKALEGIGGKWNRKLAGFVFPHDPAELLEQIQGGEKRNLKKEYQFFATPDHLARMMVDSAEMVDDHLVLEPSAGTGALIDAIHSRFTGQQVFYCEKMPANLTILDQKYGCRCNVHKLAPSENDFLQMDPKPVFDRIIANPPFSGNQDIDHIHHMMKCLKPGGILVTIASIHWQLSEHKKEQDFRCYLEQIGAEISAIPPGTFSESGTAVAACMLKVKKPAE